MLHERLMIVVGTFTAYIMLFLLNNYFFSSLEFSKGVNWIYLPSGFRLMFVLIFVEWGAIGLVLASMYINHFYYFNGNLLSIVGIGLISGFSPLLARYVCRDTLGMDLELRNLTSKKLISVSIIFALLSSSLHQVFFVWQGHSDNYISSTFAMFVGDLIGTMIILYVLKYLISLIRFKT